MSTTIEMTGAAANAKTTLLPSRRTSDRCNLNCKYLFTIALIASSGACIGGAVWSFKSSHTVTDSTQSNQYEGLGIIFTFFALLCCGLSCLSTGRR